MIATCTKNVKSKISSKAIKLNVVENTEKTTSCVELVNVHTKLVNVHMYNLCLVTEEG